ncbi:sensor histidine kinase [Intrasporangium oryzae]|nr:HAMP domain-containing sensor histidine kinase [Intrasporangium oryzae]
MARRAVRGPRSIGAQGDPVARAERSIALRVSLTTAVVVLVAIVGAGLIFDRQQLAEIGGRVEAAARTADDVADAPPGVWIVEVTSSGHKATPGTPEPVVTAAVEAADGTAGPTSITAMGRSWPAFVDPRSDRTFVTVYDIRLHTAEEQRLITATAIAGGLGILLAALTGLLAGRRAVRPLAEALELQRQFVADASHELRTPLAVISTRAQLLRRHLAAGAAPARVAEADQLVADTKAMADVVSDLLLSAQLEHADVPAERVDLATIASDVVASLGPYAADHGVTLTVSSRGVGVGADDVRTGDVEPGGAASGGLEPVVVNGVGTSLRRAVLALVDNAIAHSPQGARVDVEVGSVGDEAWLDVVDHGSGVDPDDIDRLTRRFARARDDGGGRRVGLGLALVSQVVRSHGGRLEVAETAGGGATFSLVLPLAPVV